MWPSLLRTKPGCCTVGAEIDVESELDGVGDAYGKKVGERLRAIRRQKGMSLQEAEEASEQEFKASVLGAYERGERAISVPRLQRLARFYRVPVDQLLPYDEDGQPPPALRRGRPAARRRRSQRPRRRRQARPDPPREPRWPGSRDARPLPADDP